MPIPKKILEALAIIPLYSHTQAQRMFAKHNRTIIYYIIAKDTEEEKNKVDNDHQDLFIFCRPSNLPAVSSSAASSSSAAMATTREIPLWSHEEFFFANNQFIFRGNNYYSIVEMLQDNPDLSDPLLKQEIIANFLNKTFLIFESTFFLTQGDKYVPDNKWEVRFPRDIIVGFKFRDEEPQATPTHEQFQIIMKKPTELIFKNGDEDFAIYHTRLNKILGFNVDVSSGTYAVHGNGTVAFFYYWQIDAHQYDALLRLATCPDIPSLKDLCFRTLAKHNPFSLFKTYAARDRAVEGIPKDLLNDPRFVHKP